MAAKKDYYEVLGIKRDADDAAIKKAYRKLAKKYHPDSNGGNAQAEQKFKEVTEAYTILSDPEKRKLYDRFGHAAFDGTGAAPVKTKFLLPFHGIHFAKRMGCSVRIVSLSGGFRRWRFAGRARENHQSSIAALCFPSLFERHPLFFYTASVIPCICFAPPDRGDPDRDECRSDG